MLRTKKWLYKTIRTALFTVFLSVQVLAQQELTKRKKFCSINKKTDIAGNSFLGRAKLKKTYCPQLSIAICLFRYRITIKLYFDKIQFVF